MQAIGIICVTLLLVGCANTVPEGYILASECPSCSCPTTLSDDVLPMDSLAIHFIDVGQGDAILLKYLDKEMLIDCGKNSKGYEVVDFLQDQGVTELDYLLITRPNIENIGGCDDVIREIKTKVVIMNGETKDTHTYNSMVDEINKQKQFGLQSITAKVGDSWDIGDAQLKIIQANNQFDDTDQNSIVSKLTYGVINILFTGGCIGECEELLLNKDIGADILKVAKSGSKLGTNLDFLNAVNPEIAIIQVGEVNNYGYPSNEVLDRLDQERVKVYRTDIEGRIIIKANKLNYEII